LSLIRDACVPFPDPGLPKMIIFNIKVILNKYT
jgi:hypothetical protein